MRRRYLKPGRPGLLQGSRLTGQSSRSWRGIPAKEMALLFEIFDRARSDPDLTRPALLLCSAYAERVARMLDQHTFPTVTSSARDTASNHDDVVRGSTR
jgi:hypothetical protein